MAGIWRCWYFRPLVAGFIFTGALSGHLISPRAERCAVRYRGYGCLRWLAADDRRAQRGNARAPWRYLVLGGLLSAVYCAELQGLKDAQRRSLRPAVFTLTPVIAAGRLAGCCCVSGHDGTYGVCPDDRSGCWWRFWVIFRGSSRPAPVRDRLIGEGV